MTLNPFRAAYQRGVTEGRRQAVDHLRENARRQRGQVGDARRRGALNAAADAIRDHCAPGRPA